MISAAGRRHPEVTEGHHWSAQLMVVSWAQTTRGLDDPEERNSENEKKSGTPYVYFTYALIFIYTKLIYDVKSCKGFYIDFNKLYKKNYKWQNCF